MIGKRRLITDVTTQPLTLSQVKSWLNIEAACTEFDTMLTELIPVARQKVEDVTNFKLGGATLEFVFPRFDSELWLEIATIETVESVKYYDGVNDIQTLAPELYETQLIEFPYMILPAFNVTYPLTYTRHDAVIVQVVTGNDYPKPLLTAMKMILGHWFENRQDVIIGHGATEVPQASQDLMNIYKLQILR